MEEAGNDCKIIFPPVMAKIFMKTILGTKKNS